MSTSKTKAQERADRAAKALAEARRKERRRNLLTGVGVGLVIVLIVVAGFVLNMVGDDSDQVAEQAAEAGSTEFGLTIGPDDAPHTVVIYEDFLCPICGELEAAASDGLTAAAAAGAVQVDYRPIVILDRFGPYSGDAANAFFVVRDEAGEEVAKTFHDLLYEDQPSESGPFPDTDWLVEKAVEAGADEDAVRPGIEAGDAEQTYQDATDEAVAAGVTGTPTVLLDGEVFREGSSMADMGQRLVDAVSDDTE
ncbi:MAG: disulfide bond formation protein DsbA [Nocardioides sp.]|nr:disulfide bond formation protein DsbA [Nocardioides sp.]